VSWRNNWVVLVNIFDDSGEKIYGTLRAEKITPKEFTLYSTIRVVANSMGLSSDVSHVFHGTKYVGTIDALEPYIYEQKRINGEL
jgi:hypothetical protein